MHVHFVGDNVYVLFLLAIIVLIHYRLHINNPLHGPTNSARGKVTMSMITSHHITYEMAYNKM